MSFTLPTFNLTVWLINNGGGRNAVPRVVTTGNLSPGRRTINAATVAAGDTVAGAWMELLLPVNTDIRGSNSFFGSDLVRVFLPGGRSQFYDCSWVDFSGGGFSNSHIIAIIRQNSPFYLASGPEELFFTADDGTTILTDDTGLIELFGIAGVNT